MQVLLSRGARVNDVAHENVSALCYAIRRGHVDVSRLLVESGADVNAQHVNGNTCVIFAAESGNLELVRMLFERGANFDVHNSHGQGAIHIAAANGRLPHMMVINYLLHNGVSVDSKTTGSSHGSASSDYENRFWELLTHLMKLGGVTPLLLASIAGHAAMVGFLLKRGADVNDPNGLPLMISAQNGHADVVKELIAKGADFTVNPLLKFGNEMIRGPKVQLTLVMSNKLSAAENALNIRRVLADAPMLTGNAGSWIQSPLYWAAQRGYVDVVRVMLESRPDGFIDCLPALSAAVRFGQSEELIDILTSRALRQEQLEYIKVD